jgi:nucleotidyltransferase/DNA polymerase involved in DNA repair
MDLSVGSVFPAPQISRRLGNQLGHIEKTARRASRKAAAWLAHRRIWSPRIAAPASRLNVTLSTELATELVAAQREMFLRTGLDVAIGASRSRSVARTASRCAGSTKVLVVEPGRESPFLAPLPLQRLEGLSAATCEVLRASGLVTIGELQRVPKAALQAEFGHQAGLQVWRTARGIDYEPVPQRTAYSEASFSTEAETHFVSGSLRRLRNASLFADWRALKASLSRRVRLMAGILMAGVLR